MQSTIDQIALLSMWFIFALFEMIIVIPVWSALCVWSAFLFSAFKRPPSTPTLIVIVINNNETLSSPQPVRGLSVCHR